MSALKSLVWSQLNDDARAALLTRPASSLDAALISDVANIVATVRREGDGAIRRLTEAFDRVTPHSLRVAEDDIAAAWRNLDSAQRDALQHAKRNIERFHQAQRVNNDAVLVEPGVECRLERRAIDAVGLYIPGGTAPLPSAVLMLAIPAAISGCRRRALCSPPQSDGRVSAAVLAAAHLCGITEIYAIGGAQAIAALAYGSDSIESVDKIFGPGNAYVTAAKMLVAQDPNGAACDMPAGPSEVLVIADDSAAADVVASDLLAQAEHGVDSQALLFCDSAALVADVVQSVGEQLERRGRGDIIRRALANSACVVFPDIDTALDASNRYAPEHLIINTRDAARRVDDVVSAGSVFVGPWAAETFGDYCSGTNHVLPTYGFANAYSGLGSADFQKTISVQQISPQGFDALANTAETMARMEGLDAHAAAVTIRRARRATQGAA